MINLTQLAQGRAVVIVRVRVAGPDFDGTPIMIERFVYVTFFEQEPREIEMRIRVIGAYGNGVSVVRDRVIQLTTLLQGNAKIVVGHPAPRIRRKRGAIKSDRIDILRGLVKGQRSKHEQDRARKSKPRNFFESIGRRPKGRTSERE